MIKRLKYHEIDWLKYQKCLENSEQYLFFAEKQYLDLLIGENWEILIYEDYEAVMPIPIVKKIGFNFVLMPLQTQQLGVFSEKDDAVINQKLLEFFQKKYKIYYYAFNAKNSFLKTLNKRNNYVLPSDDYQEIKSRYSMHRRRNVRVLADFEERIKFEETTNLEDSKLFFQKHIVGLEKKWLIDKTFFNMKKLWDIQLLKVYSLYIDGALASQAYILDAPKEQFLINFINDKNFLKFNSTSIILDKIIQKNISQKQFNFHGSNIPEIAEFYRRFGATEEQYSFIAHSKKQLLLSFLKKR